MCVVDVDISSGANCASKCAVRHKCESGVFYFPVLFEMSLDDVKLYLVLFVFWEDRGATGNQGRKLTFNCAVELNTTT